MMFMISGVGRLRSHTFFVAQQGMQLTNHALT